MPATPGATPGPRAAPVTPDASPAPSAERTPTVSTPHADPAGALTRHRFIAEVVERNPSAAAAREASLAAQARTAQVTLLEEPMISYSFAPLSIGGMRFGQTVELSQTLPTPGVRDLSAAVVEAEAAASAHELTAVQLELAQLAAETFDDALLNARAQEVLREQTDLVTTLRQSVAAQYAVGRASQAEILQAELELAELEAQQIALQAQQRAVHTRMNALLHREPQHPVAALSAPSQPSAPPSLDEALDAAQKHRPELATLHAQAEGASASVDLARRAYWPSVRVMASYNSMWPQLPHQVMAGVSLNVPLQLGRRGAAVEEAQHRQRQSRLQHEHLRADITAEVAQAHAELSAAIQTAEVISRRIVPLANDRIAAARAGFAAGREPFSAVIEALRGARDARLREHEATIAIQRRWAGLDRAMGRISNVNGAHR